jgi:hypothetical protein
VLKAAGEGLGTCCAPDYEPTVLSYEELLGAKL